MAEENNFLTSDNNVLIENNKENSSNNFDNLLNPNREVNILILKKKFFQNIVNMVFNRKNTTRNNLFSRKYEAKTLAYSWFWNLLFKIDFE